MVLAEAKQEIQRINAIRVVFEAGLLGPPERDNRVCEVLGTPASGQCDCWTGFPRVISGLRNPIAIQAAISLTMNLPE